jgi:glyceraldehyde-3-phosphate dehydrogenase/erythrose-4-phosphate dehydrogenase
MPWKDLGIDIVFECTAKFRAKENVDTIIYGVNHDPN